MPEATQSAGRVKPKKVLLIVIKNISALDYAVPLLWKIKRENPQADVSVLYCTLSRSTILRKSRFYSDVLRTCGIKEYDFADFLPNPYVRLRGLWRRIVSKSNRDTSAWRRFQHTRLRAIVKPMEEAPKRLQRALTRRLKVQEILPSLDPDIILFDNRTVTAFPGREHFYDYFARAGKRVVLLPHAPHHTGTTAFTPFDENGDRLPDYCDFWMPFRFDRSWENLPEKRSQFAYVGYPGLDSEWLSWLHSGGKSIKAVSRHRAGPLRCLFIIRKFLKEGEMRPSGHDAYVLDHSEFAYYLNLVAIALRESGFDIELVVKPHPSNDFRSVSDELRASGIPRWRITHDSIYEQLRSCDFVVSLYSTTMLMPAMAGIPVILLHSRIQDDIHQWDEMKQLYTGLQFYLENPEDLPTRLKEVTGIASKRRQADRPPWGKDVEHLRRFYPDGAMLLCLERLQGRAN